MTDLSDEAGKLVEAVRQFQVCSKVLDPKVDEAGNMIVMVYRDKWDAVEEALRRVEAGITGREG